jgi:acetyltransferase-like isoleucine patch superfamily enzyme
MEGQRLSNKIGTNVFIAEDVKMPDDIEIGHNSKIFDGTVLAPNIKIGHNTTIGKLVNFEAGVTIGNHVKIYSQSHLTTGLVIEDYVWIGPMFLGLNTKRIRHVRDFELVIEPPTIKWGARVGAGVGVNPGITIGEEAMIAAWARVTKDVPAREIWRGFPARCVGEVPEDEILDWLALAKKCGICMEALENE